jgi:NAD(P)-dependent dehydrogenase (short-subunit alcohol dehydrogenase family)
MSRPKRREAVVDAASASSAASTCWSTTSAWRRAPSIEATTDADWQEAFDQTLFPAIRMTRLAVPHIRKRGGGAIVIVSSIFGRESGGRMTYNAVKAAEISLTKSLAQQLAKDRIRVVFGRAGIDPVRGRLVVEAASRAIRKASRNSSRRSCRSDVSASPTRSARRSRFSRRRKPAGSAVLPWLSTAVSRGCFRRASRLAG